MMLLAMLVFLCSTYQPAKAGAPSTRLDRADATLDRIKGKMGVDPAVVLKSAQQVEHSVNAIGSSERRTLVLAKARWLESEALLRMGNPDQAAPLITSGLKILEEVQRPLKLKADLLTSRGYLETMRAEFAGALQDYHRSYRIYAALGEARGQAVTLQNIASLYREANDQRSALKYDTQSDEVYKGDASLSLSMHNNRGNSLSQLGQYSAADREYRVALSFAQKMNSKLLEVRILGNIAHNRVSADWLAAAHRPLNKALDLAASSSEAAAWLPQLRATEAELARKEGRYAQAARLIRRAFLAAGGDADTLAYHDAHATAYKIYKKLGRNDLALANLETLKRLDDQAASLAASANTALMAARFDYTNQNLKIAKLQAQDLQRKITYERAHARAVRLAFIAAGGVTVVIIAMLVFGIVTIRRSRNEERAAKDALAETNSALARALAAKTEFLATTSHEIRTPLNGILGMTQVMLADPALPAPTRERLGVVHSAGVTMRALVDDILDVAKMETGNMTIEQVPIDIGEVLRDVARVWEDQARARGLDFVLALDDCPATVLGDAARLRQLVFNLLSNALKFTETGQITLAGSTADGAGGKRVRIEVGDTGIGIAPDKLDEVFESFRQADASTTRRFGGTGLGLAICRNLARAMAGDVHVASELGKGTTFTIDLPLVEPASPASADAVAPGSGDALLIVDRNPITRSMLRALLEERAGAVALAASLAEAAERLERGGIALALLDESTVRAADEDWPGALRRVADAAGEGARTALLWHRPDGDELSALRASGIDAVIAKPIAGPALRDALYPPDTVSGDGIGNPHLVPNAA